MVKNKINLEEARTKRKVNEQNRRDRIKNDPVLYEEFKRKERERYHNRKKKGQIKTIADLTDREKRAQRKKWVVKTRKSRNKIKTAEELRNLIISPPMSDEELQNDHRPPAEACMSRAGSSRKLSGEKVAKRNKSKAYREINRLKIELEKTKKDVYKLKKCKEKYKKRAMRLQEKNKNTNSPRQKLKHILHGERVSPRVKKVLEFGVALTTQIEENYKKNKHSRKAKKAFGLVLAGNVVKKYRSMHKLPLQSYKKQLKKINYDNKIVDMLNQSLIYKTRNQIKVKVDVLKFFQQDDVSRLEPGIKDCITKNKVKKQKRTLMGDLINLHKKFEVECGYNVPYSTFCKFRPFWVLKPSVSKRETCACEKHENMELMFDKLKRLNVIKGFSDLDTLIKSLCCLDQVLTKEECWERACKKCCGKNLEIQEFENIKTVFDQWSKKEVKYTVKGVEKSTKKVVKEKVELEIKDLVNKFHGMLPAFMKHISNIVHQYRSISKLKKNLKTDEVLIHVDFSQNYECKYTREIQSMHFGGSRDQVTMHTGVMYFRTETNNELSVFSFCSLSESLRHDASAICAHLNKILFLAHRKIPKINAVHFLSDSPSTQYRNKTLFSLILKHLSQFSTSITWNYSECGHGKGAPDGIGGTLKRTANKLVAEGRDIPSFQVLLDCLKEKFKDSIKLFHVTSAEIDEVSDLAQKKVLPFIGTMKVHQVFWTSTDMDNLQMRRLSCFDCKSKENCKHYHLSTYNPVQQTIYDKTSNALPQEAQKAHKRVRYSDVYPSSESDDNDESEVYVGSWVGVIYDCQWYPGIVEKKTDKITVSFMARAGNKFLWPSPPDIQLLNPAHIMCRINKPPHPVSNRHFGIENVQKYDTIFNKMFKSN